MYDIGDAPTIRGTFRDVSGELADPTEVVVQYRPPSGVQTSLTASKVSVGVYEVEVPTITAAGVHSLKFYGTGDVIVAEQTGFKVRTTKFVSP